MPQQSVRQIEVEFSQRAIVEGFIGYVQRRATDSRHSRNGAVIADFIDKFAIVELKRLRTNDEIIPGVINVPASLFGPALPAMATAVTPASAPVSTPRPVAPVARPTRQAVPATPAPVQAPAPAGTTVTPAIRGSNGHVSEKKRNLSSDEKTKLRSRFVRLNGQIPEDKTVEWTAEFNEGLAPDQQLSAFQVPGFIAYLHGCVTGGSIIPRDMAAYKLYLDAHHARYPAKYPTAARRARHASPEAESQDEAARALWHKAVPAVQEMA